jgi:hypothetical protein
MKRKEPDFDAWKARLDTCLREDRHVARSWKRLSDAGLDMEEVSGLLWLACDFEGGPGYEFISSMGGLFKQQAKEAKRLARRLAEDAKAIKALCGDTAQGELLIKLEALINELQTLEKDLRRRFSKRTLNPTIYRSFLIRELKQKTKRSFYKELSFLLDAAYEAHGQDPPSLGGDALRKSYQRYVENPPKDDPFGSDPAAALVAVLILGIIGTFLKSRKGGAPETEKADMGWTFS